MKNAFFDDKKIELIVKHTCLYFGLNPTMVFSTTRKIEFSRARQIIHYLSKKHTKKSLEAIGKISLIYGRPTRHDHASVLHSIKTVSDLMETDINYLHHVQKIEYKCKESVSEITPEDIDEFNLLEFNYKLQENVQEKNIEIVNLRNAIEIIKDNIELSTDNIHLKQLLIMDSKVIDNFCETRLKPFLKMLKSKVTNEDLIKKQYETRSN